MTFLNCEGKKLPIPPRQERTMAGLLVERVGAGQRSAYSVYQKIVIKGVFTTK
jgi:hypothetical protein